MDFINDFKKLALGLIGEKTSGETTKDYIKRVYIFAYDKLGFVEFNDMFIDALKDVLRTHPDYLELTQKEKKEILLTNCQRVDDESLIILALNLLKNELT